jgi:hypothetical protein
MHVQFGHYPFLKPLPEMTATINGKRRPPPKPSASPRLLLSWLLFKLDPELLVPPLPSHCKHARSSNPLSPLPPPRFLTAVVSSSPPVKDRSSFLFLGFARGSSSLCYRRISSLTPVGAAPRPHRSAARSAAVAKLPRRRIPFAFELAYFFFTR